LTVRDDALIALVAGEGPAAHRDTVVGDRHRDHHLRQVQEAEPPIDWLGDRPYDVRFEAWVNALTWSWVSSRLAAWTSPVSCSVVRALAMGTLIVGWARNQASATAAIET
jgi:hypothetical protein